METKRLIRQMALSSRDALSLKEREEKSRVIIEKVMETGQYQRAKSLLIYVSYKSEVQTEALIQAALREGKKVYCPRVEKGGSMDFYRIFSLEDLGIGYMGIREPVKQAGRIFKETDEEEDRTLMIMPGTAFDKERNRIGYGKGYYDRYLENHTKLATIAICFQCQLRESVPADRYDKKPDIIISEDMFLPKGR